MMRDSMPQVSESITKHLCLVVRFRISGVFEFADHLPDGVIVVEASTLQISEQIAKLEIG